MFLQPKTFSAASASSFGPGGILSMADRAIPWKERPVDFVSTHGATAVYGLDVVFAFRFPNNDAEVTSAHWTGSREVYGHDSSLTLQILSYNSEPLPNIKAQTSPGIVIELLGLSRTL